MAANSPAEDIAQMLETDGIGIRGTNIFIGRSPDLDILTIVISDTGGFAPNPKWLREAQTVQCLVRGTPGAYSIAWQKAQEIKDALLGRSPTVIGIADYVLFVQIGDIINIGVDEKERPLMSSNWQLTRELESGGNRLPL